MSNPATEYLERFRAHEAMVLGQKLGEPAIELTRAQLSVVTVPETGEKRIFIRADELIKVLEGISV